jgi:very-short-patch-repair endonuclease
MTLGFEPGYIGNKRRTGYRTDIETLAEAVLQSLGIPYLFEHKVGRFSVDFALPTLGVALECDGWTHFTPTGIARDIWRDAKLAEDGWTAIHIADRVLRTNAHAAVTEALAHHLMLATLSRT